MGLDVLLWTFLAAFIIHLIDETALNGGFITWIQTNFWSTYTARMNFWFNTAFILAISLSNILYEIFGGHWIILVLIFPFGFAFHGLTVHLFWTIRQKNLSPGLPTSVLYWIMIYFFVKYGLVTGRIGNSDFWIGAALGVATVGAFLTFAPTAVIPAMLRRR